MLSSTTLAYCFVWASLTQHIAAGDSNEYDFSGHFYGNYQNGWNSHSSSTWQKSTSPTKASSWVTSATSGLSDSSDTHVKPSSAWQDASVSAWSTATAVTSSLSAESTTTYFSVATSVSYPTINSTVSATSASPSKTGTALTSDVSSTIGNTVTYDWNIGWVIAAPDGVARPVIGVNGQWYVCSLVQIYSMLG